MCVYVCLLAGENCGCFLIQADVCLVRWLRIEHHVCFASTSLHLPVCICQFVSAPDVILTRLVTFIGEMTHVCVCVCVS